MMRKTRENIIKERSETKGIQKGRNQERKIVAKNMIKKEIPLHDIEEITGLTKEEIEKLI